MMRRGLQNFNALRAALFTSAALACALPSQAQTSVWHFDEGAGQSAAGSGSADNSGTLQGAAGWTAQGKTGAALRLTGGGSVDIPTPAVDTSGDYTVAAWVKLNRLGGYQTFASIDGSVISGFFLQVRDDTGGFALTVPAADDGRNSVIASASFPAQTGVWYYVVGVHDSAAKTISLYVNGVLQQTTPYATAWKATGHTLIGRGKFNSNLVDYAHADIDEVSFSATAKVDATEMARLARETHADASTLTIDAAQTPRPLSPMLYGLMIEDINYSIDGGLYAELIRNRVFKNDSNKPAHWLPATNDGGSKISLDKEQPIAGTALTTCLRIDAASAGAGVANEGYWGIPVKPDTRYRASFYAKAASGFSGPLYVSLRNAAGTGEYASAAVKRISSEWKQYTVTLTTGKVSPSTNNRFFITTGGAGTVWLNQVSLFPPTYNNRPNGTRKDLMQILGDMKPSFLRLPGGNYLEGNTIAERFNWKETHGDIAQRPGHQDPWGYRSDDGFGLLEYLEWCEDLHMEPLLAVFAGYALNGEHVAAGPGLQPFVQDALDEIDYVTGGPETAGGKMRAKDGHPAPFPLRYVEIGNEDNFDRSGSYDGRFAAFYDAIKAKYPQLQLIATTGVKSRRPDVIDDHYYRTAQAMAGDAHHYDNYDRSGPKIFVGEWASQDIDTPWVRANEKGPTPTHNSALGDAAWMTGMERNADIVILSSYAPLLVNVNPGARQWAINLIGYDAMTSYGSPSYYAQQMFSLNHGDQILAADIAGLTPLAYSVSRSSKNGMVYIKVVNRLATAQTTQITLKGAAFSGRQGKALTLASGSLSDTNTLADPKHIVPKASAFSYAKDGLTYTFPAYSVTVLTLPTR